MATFKSVILAGANHKKSDGTSNIKIRMYHNKSVQYFSTEYYIEDYYMGKDGQIAPNYPSADTLNYELGKSIQQFRGICISLGASRVGLMTCKELKEQIEAAVEPDYEFIDFIAFAEQICLNTRKENTAAWYRSAIDTLCWYYEREKIDIRDITGSRLKGLINKLFEAGPSGKALEPGAINNYLRGIRALFNKAKDHYNNEDFNIIRVPNNPFKNLILPSYRRKKKNIPLEQIIALTRYKPQSELEKISRDTFMIMFYLMGINMTDLYRIVSPTFGRIDYDRSKTDTDSNNMFTLSIKIEPELQQLIDEYSDNNVFLSKLKNRYTSERSFKNCVNRGLKRISDNMGLEVKLTTNWARHSWASIAKNKAGVSTSDVDLCLGHINKNFRMAFIYIDIDYSIFDRSNRAVLDLLIENNQENKK